MNEDHFHLGIKALIRNSERKILLLRLGRGSWDLPGGRIHRNETVEQALKREVFEETGLTVIDPILPFKMILTDLRIPDRETDVGLIYSLHFCSVEAEAPVILSHEHNAYEWVDLVEAGDLLSWYSLKQSLSAGATALFSRA